MEIPNEITHRPKILKLAAAVFVVLAALLGVMAIFGLLTIAVAVQLLLKLALATAIMMAAVLLVSWLLKSNNGDS